MKMTKTLTLSWIPPDNELAAMCANQERWIKLMEMTLDKKTDNHHFPVFVAKNTLLRRWKDQSAVDEYIEFMHSLAEKYKGKTLVGEITDI